MKATQENFDALCNEFRECQKLFAALGDEVRQQIIAIMMAGECSGTRAVDIAEKTSLSRPAISHHLQILKDAGIVSSRKEGTCIYYYLDPNAEAMHRLEQLARDAASFMEGVPDRSCVAGRGKKQK